MTTSKIVFILTFFLILKCAFNIPVLLAEVSKVVIYPTVESPSDPRSGHPLELLKICETKQSAFVLKESPLKVTQGRSLQLLSQSRGIDIAWGATSDIREADFLPVRIPIDKGLIGWRLLLIRKDNNDFFQNLKNINELKSLRTVQGHDWPDLRILEFNKFNVVKIADYENMFKLLAYGRVDYVPRSVTEIQQEIDEHPELSLAIDSRYLIKYNSAKYFFVNKNNTDLAVQIESCLKDLISDGTFDAVFNKHFKKIIEVVKLNERETVFLENPFLPESTPMNMPSLWYRPE